MGTGASTSVDLSLIENLDEQFNKYSDDEIFGALEATVSDAKSTKQIVIQIGEIQRLLGTISHLESRKPQRQRLQAELDALQHRLKNPTFRKSEFARSLTLYAVEEGSCEEEGEPEGGSPKSDAAGANCADESKDGTEQLEEGKVQSNGSKFDSPASESKVDQLHKQGSQDPIDSKSPMHRGK